MAVISQLQKLSFTKRTKLQLYHWKWQFVRPYMQLKTFIYHLMINWRISCANLLLTYRTFLWTLRKQKKNYQGFLRIKEKISWRIPDKKQNNQIVCRFFREKHVIFQFVDHGSIIWFHVLYSWQWRRWIHRYVFMHLSSIYTHNILLIEIMCPLFIGIYHWFNEICRRKKEVIMNYSILTN